MEDIIFIKEKNSEIYNKLIKSRILFLADELTPELATDLVAKLLLLDKESQTEDITLYINSPGGDLISMFAIYDTMQYISAPIITIVTGEAASAAAVLLAAGSRGKRFAFPNSSIMIHSVLGGIDGTQKEIEMGSKRIKKSNQSMIELIARSAGQSLRKVKRDCSKDKFMSPNEAIKYGLIDHIMKYNKEIPDFKK